MKNIQNTKKRKTFSPENWEHAHSNGAANLKEKRQQTTPYIYNKECKDLSDEIESIVQEAVARGIDIAPSYDDYVKLGFALARAEGEAGREHFVRLCSVHGTSQADATKQYASCLKANPGNINIGTLFYLAKQAGITPNRQNKENDKMAKWQKEDTVLPNCQNAILPKETRNGKTEESKIAEPVIAVEASDATPLPSIPQSVYDNLPDFLKQVTRSALSDNERDMMLMGTITCISSTLPMMCGIYDNRIVYPMIYFFVLAEAGMGKGALSLCKEIIQPIDTELYEISRLRVNDYKRSQREARARGQSFDEEEPPLKMHIIPANSSASVFVEQLDQNGGVGIMFETECDTLASALKSDFGDFSSPLRMAFHHEPIKLRRRKDNEFRRIERPKLAVCISGTPGQLQHLIPDTENGLFSRFVFLHIPFKEEFRDTLAEDTITNSTYSRFCQLGERYKELRESFYRQAGGTEGYIFSIPPLLHDRFHTFFLELNRRLVKDVSVAMQGVVRRLALVTYRIMMVLTAVRNMDKYIPSSAPRTKDNYIPLVCAEEDFTVALEIIDTLVQHSVYTFNCLPSQSTSSTAMNGKLSKSASKRMAFYADLPESFGKEDYTTLTEEKNLSVNTTNKWIEWFIKNGLIERTAQGDYRKLAQEQGTN